MTSVLASDRTSSGNPSGSVILFALMMVLIPALGVPNEAWLQDTLKSILVSLFTLAATFLFFWERRKKSVATRFHVLLALPLSLMVYALFSMLWSHTYLGGVEAIRWYLFSLIFFVGVNTLTLTRVTCLAWGIHLGAVMASLWAASQFWMDVDIFGQIAAPASTFLNRNFFAEYLVCTLPFSIFLVSRFRNKIAVFFLVFSLGFNVVALWMTGTRSALVGFLLLLLLVPVIIGRYREQFALSSWAPGYRVALVLVLFSSIAGLGSIDTTSPRLIAESGPSDAIDRALKRAESITKSIEYTQGSMSVRAEMWKSTGKMIKAHPLAGVGAGAWEVQVPLYQVVGSQYEIDYFAHNELLQLVAEYGLVAWLFLIGLLSYLLWSAFITWGNRSADGQREGLLRALMLATLLVLLAVSNAGFPWRLATTGALFALSLAVLAASDIRAGAPAAHLLSRIDLRSGYSLMALWVTVICTALAVYIAQQAIESEVKLLRAYKLANEISRSNAHNDPRWNASKNEVERLARESISINPHNRKISDHVAAEFALWGDWKNAAWIWESIYASRPNIVAIAANISRAHFEMGDLRKSQVYFQRAAMIQPTAPAVRSMQARLAIAQGFYPQAAQAIRAHLETNGVDDDFLRLAYTLGTRTRDWSLAITALKSHIDKFPNESYVAWLLLGQIYSSSDVGNETLALESYSSALTAAPDDAKNALLPRIPAVYRKMLGK